VNCGRALGGTEKVLLDSAVRLAARGERVAALLAPGPALDPLEERLGAAGVRSERWEEVGSPGRLFARTVRRLAARAPDVVHVHLPWPHANAWFPAAARLAGVGAVVATEHIQFPARSRREDARKRLLAPLVDRTVAVSRAIALDLSKRWGYAASRVVVIPNGVDRGVFRGADPAARARGRARLGIDEGSPLVGSVGRLEEQKNFGALVRAAATIRARFPNLHVAIAGEGSEAGPLRAAAGACGLGERLRLPGRIDDVADFLAALDLFVLPSLWEGMPLSLLEAMAMEAPVVATATPGAEEVLGGVEPAGLLVAPGDDGALSEAMASLLADPARARALGRAGAARVGERYDAAPLFERLVAVYDEVTDRGVR